jgi:hypothetical protein
MQDDDRTEPFVWLGDKDTPPRPGPTMAAIVGELGKLRALAEQVLRRQQQTALMVDGLGNQLGRRFDVLHEESALMRVQLARPGNDAAEHIEVDVEPTPGQRAQRLMKLSGRYLSYGTTAAIVLRLIAHQFPEYAAAIDGLLGLFGL